MSNATAAYYTYLARVDRDRAKVFRNFGYHASAAFVENRADRYEREARAQSETPPTITAGGVVSPTDDSRDSDLHTTSEE